MNYKNFSTALFCTVFDVEHIDWGTFDDPFRFIEKNAGIDKVYLETYRAEHFVSADRINEARKFFEKKGISCSGGITFSAKGRTSWDFRSFCYSNQRYVDEMIKVIEYTAALFDEIILDDFYFTNCKCEMCIREKGDTSWDDYRTEKLREMSKLMVKHAKLANKNVRVIIKYPNWYDDYQHTGYNLRDQREIHGYLYTGTETRDSALTQQNLPRYLSYFLMRYIETAMPGKNMGGWFDPFDCSHNLNSYLEQAYLTMFAKSREVTLFCLGAFMRRDFRQFVPLAGFALERVDAFLGKLGNPSGIACYKPFNSEGDNYFLPALGMLGIPLEPTPFFPEDADTVILSESASADADIIDRIKGQLKKRKTVVITSTLAKALHDRGLRDIVDLDFGGTVAIRRIASEMLLCGYKNYADLSSDILVPRVIIRTNDSWPVVAGQGGENGYPLLTETTYAEGKLIVLVVPERYSDMYAYPVFALDSIRCRILGKSRITISAPAGVGIFLYDNNCFIVESFLARTTPVTITVRNTNEDIIDLETGEKVEGRGEGGNRTFTLDLAASTFRAFGFSGGNAGT
jgi:hypothetical protein